MTGAAAAAATLRSTLAQAAAEEAEVDPFLAGVVITVIAVVLGVLSGWALWTTAKRKRGLPAVAERAGLSFSDEDPFHCDRVPFPLFREGDVRRVEHVMWNPDTGARVFDYAYAVERRDQNGNVVRTWSTFTCATARHDGRWPELRLLRERVFDRALQRVGLPDIDLESEEFNRMFLVQCEDRRFATDLLDPQMMDFLLGTQGRVSIETKGRELLVTSRRVAPELFPGLLGIAEGFVQRVPRLVWELYGRYPQGGAPSIADTWIDAQRDDAGGLGPAGHAGPSVAGDGWRIGGHRGPAAPMGYGVGPSGAWRGTWEAERLDARRRATTPDDPVEYDLDGNPVDTSQEDPWGDGRAAPTGEFDLDGNPIGPTREDPWGDGAPRRS